MTKHVLTLTVEAPDTVSRGAIVEAVNAALDEPPCDWGDWIVGAVVSADDPQ